MIEEKVREMEENLRALWEELLEQRLTNDQLRRLILFLELLKVEAGEKLMKQNPTDHDLRHIILWVEPLRTEAQKLLEK